MFFMINVVCNYFMFLREIASMCQSCDLYLFDLGLNSLQQYVL